MEEHSSAIVTGTKNTDPTDPLDPDALAAHEQWLQTKGKKGTQLNRNAPDLQGRDLAGKNLRGASLPEAHLQKADLTNTILWDADLSHADLTDAKGIGSSTGGQTSQLSGANLFGATLPPEVTKFARLGNVEELSKNAGKLFLSMITADAFMQLIVARTTDVDLLTNSGTTKIPVLDAEIAVTTLFWLGPLVLFILYVSFHLYLQRLWEMQASLPAIFPDGMTLTEKSYPWLVNDLVRGAFPRLRERPQPLATVQRGLFWFLAYLLVPLTVFPFWARYLARHDWTVTWVHIVLSGLFLYALMVFSLLARATLHRDERVLTRWRDPWHGWKGLAKAGMTLAFILVAVSWSTFVLVLSRNAVDWGIPRERYVQSLRPDLQALNWGGQSEEYGRSTRPDVQASVGPVLPTFALRRWVPRVLETMGYRPFADFKEAELSIKPDNWTDSDKDNAASIQKPVRLYKSNLRYANLNAAFLAKGDLRGASLVKVDGPGADLRAANLSDGNLSGANLKMANLSTANLSKANLSEAILTDADLTRANIRDANLHRADLSAANLSKANLSGANLNAARLRSANLSGADLNGADLRGARLSGANLSGVVLLGANLTGANLVRANLKRTTWVSANLKMANLSEADLSGAELGMVNLSGAKLDGCVFDQYTRWPANFHVHEHPELRQLEPQRP